MKKSGFVLMLSIVLFLFGRVENIFSGISKTSPDTDKLFISLETETKFQSGDIVLRSGKGFISDVFRQFSKNDKKYSHAGIISLEDEQVYVYHILGGKTINGGQLRKELLSSFCDEKENSSVAVYRYDLNQKEVKNMMNALEVLKSKQMKFDSHFDLSTDSSLYCTELIYKLVEASSMKKNYLPFTIVDGQKYIAPDNLYINSHATLIFSNQH